MKRLPASHLIFPCCAKPNTEDSNGGKFEFLTSYQNYSRQPDHRRVVRKSFEHAALSGSKSFKSPALAVVTDFVSEVGTAVNGTSDGGPAIVVHSIGIATTLPNSSLFIVQSNPEFIGQYLDLTIPPWRLATISSSGARLLKVSGLWPMWAAI